MAPVAIRMKLVTSANASMMIPGRIAGCKTSIRSVQRVPRHVVRATKVADLENSIKPEKKSKHDDDDDECDDGAGLSPQQVEDFLNVLCEETDIAEVELKMGGFKMKVRRSVKAGGASAASPLAAAAAPVPTPTAPAPALAHSPISDMESSFDEDDGSVIAIPAPKVGILRRGRYLKGKQIGKAPAIEEGDKVKKGQVVAYIEQLGTHFPVECPQAGEVAAFLVEEGQAVEYMESILEIAPFFGGHIIGDSKFA